MKIGFVLYDYYPFGGLQEDCLATAVACASRGHDVHIFCRSWKGERPENIQVHTLGTLGWSNIARNQQFFKQFEAFRPEYALDGVVAFNRIPNADVYYAADPCYLERHKDTALWKKWLPRYRHYAALEARIFNSASTPTTLVLTAGEIEALTRHYAIPSERFHLLPPGVARNTNDLETQARNRVSLRQELGTAEAAIAVLLVGSGFRVKGLDRALRALQANQTAVQSLEFWVVGNDSPSRFQKLADDAGITVRFLGGRHDVARFYDAADCLLHPAYSESAGKVLLEALTHGLPVLTTDTCGYATHIDAAKAGVVLASPFSQSALNETLRRCLTDAETRRKWSQNALAYASNNDLYSCHTAAAQIIEQTLSRS